LIGGAFAPDVSPDGGTVAFSSYRAAGYDVHVMPLDLAAASAAAPFVDLHPPSRPTAAEYDGVDRPYRPLGALKPRFWTPYFEGGDEFKLGAATGGADPLFRHVYGTALEHGFETGRFGFHGFYQYDRWLPTLLLSYDDTSDPAGADAVSRGRELHLQATVPLQRSLRRTQSLSVGWRRSRDTIEETTTPSSLDFGGIETAWSMTTVRQFPYSVSPAEGVRIRVAYLKEAEALGSDVSVGKATADLRGYRRVFTDNDTLALRVGAGTTFGQPSFERSYAVGGFPDGSLFDVVQTNHSVLRGYEQDAFRGRRFAHANAEYRIPLGHPQRGWRTLPFFLRHVHAAVFADAANAWSGSFQLDRVKVGAGAALGVDFSAGPSLAFTLTAGLAHGFSDSESVRTYFRTGLSF
jgi:outer membrane protein assembly factor BamA